MSHLERKQREKEEVKRRIVEAARKIGARDGWSSLTIRKIADEIEYTPPIVYEHFENKEDLIREIINSGHIQQHKEFAELRKTESDPRKLLRTITIKHWDFAFDNSELYQLMFSLERPTHSEEMMANVRAIEGIFLSFAKDEEEMHEIILQWMCMITGAITVVMKLTFFPHLEKENPRDVFIKMIDRFIERLG
jgi:AcrR family transcriptional regulator